MLGLVYGDMVGTYFNHYQDKTNLNDFSFKESGFGSFTVLYAYALHAMRSGDFSKDLLRQWVERYGNMDSNGDCIYGVDFGSRFYSYATSTEYYIEELDTNRYFPYAMAAGKLFKDPDDAILNTLNLLESVNANENTAIQTSTLAAIVAMSNSGFKYSHIKHFVSSNYDAYIDFDASVNTLLESDKSSVTGLSEAVKVGLLSKSTKLAVQKMFTLGGDMATLCSVAGGLAQLNTGGSLLKMVQVDLVLRKTNKELLNSIKV